MSKLLQFILMIPLLASCKQRSGNPEVAPAKSDSSSTFLPPSFESMYGKKFQSQESNAHETDLCTMEYDPHRCYLIDAKGAKNPKIYWDGGNPCVARQNAAKDPANDKYRSKKDGVPLKCERQN